MRTQIKSITKKIQLSQIQGLHPSVSQAASIISEQTYTSRFDVFSSDAAHLLLSLHPIFITKVDGNFYVVAGFRSFQLALITLDFNEKISAQVIDSLSNEQYLLLAETDILGSVLQHSLGTKSVTQIENIKNHLTKESVNKNIPGISSTRSITKYESIK